jgi:pilus assembly protein CpaE
MSISAASLNSDRELFSAFLCEEDTKSLFEKVALEREWSQDMCFSGGIAASVRALGAMPCPELLIVDLSESDDPREDMQSLAEVCEPGTIVVAVGEQNDVSLYRDLIHAGVHDYLVKPLSLEQIRECLTSAEEAMTIQEEEPVAEEVIGDKKQIVFVGLRGGLGTSTIVTNIAWLAAEKGENTALLDMDFYFGTSALQFDLEPGRGLADALENPNRVDGLFLERAVVKPHKNLAILGAEAPLGSLRAPSDDALPHLIEALGENYQTVFVDLPRQVLGEHGDILSAATDIVLISDYSLTAARDCIRLLSHIKFAAPSAKVHIVTTRQGQNADEVDSKDFENSIERSIAVNIPFEPRALVDASKKGKILIDALPNSKPSTAIRQIAGLFNNTEEIANKGASWMGKLLGKKN